MKNSILSILTIALLITGCSKGDDTVTPSSCDFIGFKYYKDAPDYLGPLSNDYLLIGIDSTYSNNAIQNFIATQNDFDQNYNYTIYSFHYKFKEIPLKFAITKSCEEITQIISNLKQKQIIAYAHYTMQTDDCSSPIWEPMGDLCINSYGGEFYVKVFDKDDLTDLNQMIAQTETELVKQNQFMEHWFELRATKSSKGDALAMANFFYESGLFEYSEPGISKYAVE